MESPVSAEGAGAVAAFIGEGGVPMLLSDEERTMFSHVMVGSNDISRSKTFYDALFVAMGGKPGVRDAKGRLVYRHDGGLFMVSKPVDGKPATPANGGTIGFWMRDPEQADAWHQAGVATGGTTIEAPLGCAKGSPARNISPTFAIPTATSCAPSASWQEAWTVGSMS